ncbi:MAG: hypothetical protein P4L84_07750 [Isosphaeraceae bacterium]|nr:hypothetical protein [Isosphaeraceae bacterium]
MSLLLVFLGMIYGACIGCFALFGMGGPNGMQLVSSTLKVPALFFLTLLVTLPSLYVFNALVGSRLTPSTVLRLLVAALAVMIAVLSSLGPIVAFFSVSTTSYSFMVLLNVVVFGGSGILGLLFLLQTLHRLSVAESIPPEDPAPGAAPDDDQVVLTPVTEPGALDRLEGQVLGRHVKTVFRIWIIVFGLVGAQMGWVLRPFIGDPARPFAWFRPRESNFFQAVFHAFLNLFG